MTYIRDISEIKIIFREGHNRTFRNVKFIEIPDSDETMGSIVYYDVVEENLFMFWPRDVVTINITRKGEEE